MVRKLTSILLASVLSVSAVGIAAAQTQSLGSITSVTGTVYIERSGTLILATENNEILIGDRVITDQSSSLRLDANAGCDVTVPGGVSTVFTDSNVCGPGLVAIPLTDAQLASLGSTGAVPAGGGLLAPIIAGSGLAAAANANDDDTPSSPE